MYTRRVSFNEKLYLAMDQLEPGLCIQIALEGEGAIELDALERAVAEASLVNPGARLILKSYLGWMRWAAIGPHPVVRRVNSWTGQDVPPEVERSLSPKTGPTCEVVYAPVHTPATSIDAPTRVVFRCFHGVMDARGLLHFAEDVFRSLRGEPLVGAECRLTDTELVESLVGHRTRKALKGERRSVNGARSRRRGEIIARRVSLAGPLPGLVARVATTLASYSAQHHDLPMRAMIPVDVRHYQRDLRSTGNLTCPLFLDIDPDQDWRRLHRKILKSLGSKAPLYLDPAERIARWMPLWVLRSFYRVWSAWHRRIGLYPVSALISHVSLDTLTPLEGCGFSRTSAYFLPPPGDAIPLVVSVVSDRSAVQIVVSGPDSLLSDEHLDELCVALTTGCE